MQRDVKVGLVLGVLLVAVVAVIFFRKEDPDRERLSRLVPGPDVLANKTRSMLGSSPSDPYPVPPEHLAPKWQSPFGSAATRTPPARSKPREPSPASDDRGESKKPAGASAFLQPPKLMPVEENPRPKRGTMTSASKPATTEMSIHGNNANEYTIQPGDTLSDIAASQLGDASLYPQIFEANRDILSDPNHLPVGQRIRLPETQRADRQPAATAPREAPHEAPPSDRRPAAGQPYTVKEGDSLIKIARRIYGDPDMYEAIFEANRDQLVDRQTLPVGTVLRLPPKE